MICHFRLGKSSVWLTRDLPSLVYLFHHSVVTVDWFSHEDTRPTKTEQSDSLSWEYDIY